MTFDPARHHRRSIRLRRYDYAQPGLYFVTLCTQGRVCLFGEVEEDVVRLNAVGRMVAAQWEGLPMRFPTVQLDVFVVMPNHVHGLLGLADPPGP